MQRKFYLDTSIWRDYYEDRKDNMRPLGLFAFQFLKNCEKHGCKVLYSELVIYELKKDYSDERIKQLFSSFEHLLELVPISKEQHAEAEKIARAKSGTHSSDALHAILARDNNVILVARDNHFEPLRYIVEIQFPEEVTFD